MDDQPEISGEVEFTDSYFEILANQFPLVGSKIFGYLGAKDLKECFLINKQCNAIIGKAPRCMDNFVVRFVDWEEEEKMQGVSMSCRKYQNIELRSVDIDRCYEEIFKKGKGRWKSADFFDCCFDSEKSMKIVIDSISQTVEEMRWNQNVFQDQNVHDRTLNFPKLTKLMIITYRFPNWFASCKTLANFSVIIHKEEDGQVESVQRVQQLLQQNPELKVLELRGFPFLGVFDGNFWKNVPFQLDKLVVAINLPPPSPFMAHFLETQIKSLKKLSISGGFNLICLEVIFRMHKLQKLEILYFDADAWILNWNELSLPQNNSIESLDIDQLGENNDNILEALIRPVPNIKHFVINELTDRIFNFLSTNSRCLESIRCYYFRVSAACVLAGDSLPNLNTLVAVCYNYTEEELEQLRADPINQNQVHALLRGSLQYMKYQRPNDFEDEDVWF